MSSLNLTVVDIDPRRVPIHADLNHVPDLIDEVIPINEQLCIQVSSLVYESRLRRAKCACIAVLISLCGGYRCH